MHETRPDPETVQDPVAAVDGAVGVVDIHAALEDVAIFFRIGPGRFRAGQVQQLAQLGEKELVVGALLAAGIALALDEGFDRLVFRRVAGFIHAPIPLSAVLKPTSNPRGGGRARRGCDIANFVVGRGA